MDEFINESQNPFDRFLASPDLEMLNSALPYVGDTFRKPLALYIKMVEIQRIVTEFDDEEVLTACGFEENNPNLEAMLKAMKAAGGKDVNPQVDMMLNMLNMVRMYQSCMELIQKNPELINLINGMMNQKTSATPSSPDGLSQLLPFLMSQQNSSQGSSQDPSDMMNILSEFLKKQEL